MGDDEWQVATGKRTRPFKAVENPSKRFKSPPDDLMMNLQEPKPSFTLQTISKKKKQKQRVLGPDGIVTKDLQNLIFWIYDIGINQKWIMIKNKDLIEKIVVLSIGGLNHQIFKQYTTELSNLRNIFQLNSLVTVAPGSEFKIYSPLQALLYTTAKKKKKTTPEPQEDLPGVEEYVHSLNQLLTNGYPLRIKDVSESTEDKVPVRTIEYEPLPGYIVFDKIEMEDGKDLIGIDCEMCKTKNGAELTRVTVIDSHYNVVYDELVKPEEPIIDYLTQYSGISKELLDPVTTTLSDVQNHLKSFISKDSIIVGHSLENDLHALKVSHFRVIDTAICFPHPNGPPSKHSLKGLVRTHLNRVIQTGAHDSSEDAISALQLAKLKISRGPSYGIAQNPDIKIFETLREKNIKGTMVDRAPLVNSHCGTNIGISCTTDDEVVDQISAITNSGKDSPQFIYSQFHDLSSYFKSQASESDKPEETIEDILKGIDTRIKKLYDSLPDNTFFIVTSGQANLANCSKLWGIKRTDIAQWNDNLEKKLKLEIETARLGVSLFAMK